MKKIDSETVFLLEKNTSMVFQQLGESKKMVLSTSVDNHVTSRMMSVIIIDGNFYFQTDRKSRKFEQIAENPKAALCVDNVQVEGECREVGQPSENRDFCTLYEKYYPNSYKTYTFLADERLICLKPTLIKRWIYEEGKPYEEIFDFQKGSYEKKAYHLA